MTHIDLLAVWGLSLGLWLVIIVVIGVVLILVLYLLYYYFLKKKGAIMPLPCGLRTYKILRDECAGSCPPGQQCIVTATRPYGPKWLGLKPQAAACACAPIPGGTGGSGTGGGGTGGSGTAGNGG